MQRVSVSGAQYLVPESLPIQSNDDHGRIREEALVIEWQVFPFPRHIQHVPANHKNFLTLTYGESFVYRLQSRNSQEFAYSCTQVQTNNDNIPIKPKAPPGGTV